MRKAILGQHGKLLIFLVGQCIIFQMTDRNLLQWTKQQQNVHQAKEKSICDLYGLHGPIKPNAIATIVSTARFMNVSSFGKEVNYRIPNVWYSWSRLEMVNFVVMSSNCEVLQMAREANLPTLRVSSGSEIRDLTVFHMFQTAEKYSTTPIVGFANGDIAFDESLPQTLSALLDQRQLNPEVWNNFFIVGQRSNVDVPDHFLNAPIRTESQWLALNDYSKRNSSLFLTSGMDYFLFNRGIKIAWEHLPPFLVGGVKFDNWIIDYLRNRPDIQLVDATVTLRAFHFNHDSVRFTSHVNLASEINGMVLDKHPFRRFYGETTHGEWTPRFHDESQKNIHFVLKPCAASGMNKAYPWKNKIKSLSRKSGTIFLTAANKATLDMASKWVAHLRTLGIEEYGIVAEDRESFKTLGEKFGDHHLLAFRPDDHYFKLRTVHLSTLSQPSYILGVLSRGANVVWSDVGSSWFQNPFEKDFSIGNATDGAFVSNAVEQSSEKKLSVGVMFFRASEGSQRVLRLWMQKLESHCCTDIQPVFNEVLRLQSDSFAFQELNSSRFLPGRKVGEEGDQTNDVLFAHLQS